MIHENELAMIVAFYLSKFGDDGLERLGFSTYKQAFETIGRSLNVNPNSVKNWRDEFDPYYDNGRKGWYQRNIRPSRLKVIETFDDLSEDALRAVVLDIIQFEGHQRVETELEFALKEIKKLDVKGKKIQREFIARVPTGRKAEEFFISKFHAGLTPFEGELQDYRDNGVGYDFEINFDRSRSFIEIKGLSKELGGISFTDKEWKVAKENQDSYFLGLVVGIPDSPKMGFLKNPVLNFTPTYRAYTTVSVNWAVSSKQLQKVEFE